jgi:hypothetical protein
MILLPFEGCLLCPLLFPLLCTVLRAMLPIPPLIVPLSVRTFVHALVDRLHLPHEHHAHVCGHAIRWGMVLLEELDDCASKRCALLDLI